VEHAGKANRRLEESGRVWWKLHQAAADFERYHGVIRDHGINNCMILAFDLLVMLLF